MFNVLSIDIFLLVNINVSFLPYLAVAWRKQIFILRNMITSERVPKSEKNKIVGFLASRDFLANLSR